MSSPISPPRSSTRQPQLPRKTGGVVSAATILFAFGGLATIANYFLWTQHENAQTDRLFQARCPLVVPNNQTSADPDTRYRLPYTGSDGVDIILCALATFFTEALTKGGQLVTIDLIGFLPLAIIPILLDCASHFRKSRVGTVLVPLLIGIVYQVRTGGLTMPIYWTVSLIVRTRQYSAGILPTRPDKTAVEGVALATLFYSIVSILLIIPPVPDAYVNVLWQIMPIPIALIQTFYFIVRSRRDISKDDTPEGKFYTYFLTQSIFIGAFFFAFALHMPVIAYMIDSRNPFRAISEVYFPSLSTPPPSNPDTLVNEVERFLQWDAIFIVLTTYLVGVWGWVWKDRKLFGIVLLGSVVTAFAAGPAAPLAAVWTWKQRIEEEERIQFAPVSSEEVNDERARLLEHVNPYPESE